MKKILISIILTCVCFLVKAQYNPSLFTASNKPYGSAQGFATDARSFFFDATNFTYRPYQNNAEVLTYLNLAKYRTGNFPIIINVGGILSGGLITGGVNSAWWFQNCTADSCLVLMIPAAGACAGCLINTNNLSDVSNVVAARANLGLQNMSLQTTAAGGDLSGFWPTPTVAKFNGLPPSYYLNFNNLINQPVIPAQFNPIAGTYISLAGSYPNITISANNNAAGATAGYGINATLLAAGIVAIDSLNYRKQDTTYTVNDSTVNITINGKLYTLTIRGGVHGSGSGAGTVTNFAFTNANGVSGSVSNPTSTPNLTITLGAITPTSVNALTLLALTNGFSITGGVTPAVLTVPSNATVSGTNTGDVTLTGQTYLTISGQQINAHPIDVSGTNITGILKAASFPGVSGDVVISAGTLTSTIQPNVVTYAKIQTIAAGSLIGNPSLSLGNSKAVFAKYGLLFDADSLKVDTTLLKTIFGTGGGGPGTTDTLFVVNTPTGGLGFPLTRVSGDTAYIKKLFCVGCVLDSTTNPGGLTITATGSQSLQSVINVSNLLTKNDTVDAGNHDFNFLNVNTFNVQAATIVLAANPQDQMVLGGGITINHDNGSGHQTFTSMFDDDYHTEVNSPTDTTRFYIAPTGITITGTGLTSGTAVNGIGINSAHKLVLTSSSGSSGGAINDSTTSGSNTTLSLPAGNALYMIIVQPVSNTTSFNVGTVSGSGNIVPTQSLTGGVNTIFTPNFYTTGGVTLFFTGITSSTFIKIKKL